MSRGKHGAVALLTGASSGLGRALAAALVSRGWRVALVARRAQALHEIAANLGPAAIPVPLDLTVPGTVDHLRDALGERDISPREVGLLVNNAAVGSFGSFLDTPSGRLGLMQHLNLRVPMELTHWMAGVMVERGEGVVCNIASVAAFSAGPLMTEYYADKAWMRSFGLSLDAELRPRGVAVVTVCPGPFASGFHAGAGMAQERMGRLKSAESVARATIRAIERRQSLVAVGLGARLWAVLGPRLQWRFSRLVMYALQRRRLEG